MDMRTIKVPEGVRHHKTGVILPEGLRLDQWYDYGVFLQTAQRSLSLWKADWLHYGERSYGVATVRAKAEQLDLQFAEIKTLEHLSRVGIEQRNDALSAEHHLVVAKELVQPVEREEWLQTAERENLSARDLQASIRANAIVRAEPKRRSAGVPNIQGVRMHFDLWLRQVRGDWEGWPPELLAALWEEIGPIVEFGERVRSRMRAQMESEKEVAG